MGIKTGFVGGILGAGGSEGWEGVWRTVAVRPQNDCVGMQKRTSDQEFRHGFVPLSGTFKRWVIIYRDTFPIIGKNPRNQG
jgi:hypothetical protein